MSWKFGMVAVLAMVAGPLCIGDASAQGTMAQGTMAQGTDRTVVAQNGCTSGERIDGSNMDGTRRRIEAAGYRQVRELSKGCDNYWHGRALKDGLDVNVAVTPQGAVITEGN